MMARCATATSWLYRGVTNTLAMLRMLPMSDQAKDAESLALCH